MNKTVIDSILEDINYIESIIEIEYLNDENTNNYRHVFNFKKHSRKICDSINEIFVGNEIKRTSGYLNTIVNNELQPKQLEAIVTDEDNTLVIAGAGSGKTSVIVAKTAYLIKYEKCLPDEILILTFNKKASEEIMKGY